MFYAYNDFPEYAPIDPAELFPYVNDYNDDEPASCDYTIYINDEYTESNSSYNMTLQWVHEYATEDCESGDVITVFDPDGDLILTHVVE